MYLHGGEPHHAPRRAEGGRGLPVDTRVLAVDDKRLRLFHDVCTAPRRGAGRHRRAHAPARGRGTRQGRARAPERIRGAARAPARCATVARRCRRRRAGRRPAPGRRTQPPCPSASITTSAATRSPWSPAGPWPARLRAGPRSRDIARAAGYTTGMVAHYFDSKQEIMLAALRLILRRMRSACAAPGGRGGDAARGAERSAAARRPAPRRVRLLGGVLGPVAGRPRGSTQLNAWVHREYRNCSSAACADHWPEFAGLAAGGARSRCCAR